MRTGRPNRTKRRLAALDYVSSRRPLEPHEQAEVIRLAHLDRQNRRRKERYAGDPEYRRHRLDTIARWERTQREGRA